MAYRKALMPNWPPNVANWAAKCKPIRPLRTLLLLLYTFIYCIDYHIGTCPSSTSRNNFSSALFALFETSLSCPTLRNRSLLQSDHIIHQILYLDNKQQKYKADKVSGQPNLMPAGNLGRERFTTNVTRY